MFCLFRARRYVFENKYSPKIVSGPDTPFSSDHTGEKNPFRIKLEALLVTVFPQASRNGDRAQDMLHEILDKLLQRL